MTTMPHMFVCPKCGRPHTKEEYGDSRFCRECGKFLTLRNRLKVSEDKVRERNEGTGGGKLFPYTPYPQQLEFMRDVKDVVCNRGVLVAEACNGFGKTVCALSSILPERKIVYATRTHEQVRQVLLELERINRTVDKGFSAVNLASRQHLCLHEKCRGLSAIEALEACRLLKESGQCPYKTEVQISRSNLPVVLSISRLRRYGRMRGVCPYFLARKIAEHCSVIVAPYQYVFNTHIRRRVKLALSDRVMVFDEAHNADQISQDALSYTLSERTLNNAKAEIEALETSLDNGGITFILDELNAYLKKKVSEETSTERGGKLREDLKEALGVEDLSGLAAEFSYLVETIRTSKIKKGEYPICFLNGVLTFLENLDASPGESYVAVFRRSRQGWRMIEYRCLDPSLAIKPVVEEAAGALIMSGTLSPLELFAETLGLSEAEKRTYSAIANPENVRTIVDPTVTTRYTERSEEMTRRYGEKIAKLIDRIPNGVLMFFPQRQLMLQTLQLWRILGITTRVGSRTFLKGKPLFVEGIRATENRRVVEAYKKVARKEGGAVLCGVFRGRNAEGSNFPYEEARGVFLVGVPYADFSDPVVRAQIDYFNAKSRGMGNRWYTMDAFRAANQAIGRGIRHRDDWCNFILLDSRYENSEKLISRWVVANGVQRTNI